MEINRRELMTSAAAFALLANAADPRAFAQAVVNSPENAVDVSDYWTNFYSQTATKGIFGLAKQNRRTLYLQSPESGEALLYADNIPRKRLPRISGDVLVKLGISQYRPGKGDISTNTTNLRIDAAQSFDYMNLVAPLSWAMIASFTPDKKMSKLPSIDQLGFHQQADSSHSIKQITLPSGVGKLAVNVTRPSNHLFTEIVKSASIGITSVLSMMTLPAVSVPAIKVFSELFGKWQSRATVVMNGNLTPVIATSTPPATVELPEDSMALMNGYYIMYPEAHEPELKSEFNNLTVEKGFLVYKNAPASDDWLTRAEKAIPGVSYVSLRVYANRAPANACSAKPHTAES